MNRSKLLRRGLRSALLAATVLLAQALTPSFAATPRTHAATTDTTFEDCRWDRPGADPFMGNVVEAVDAYHDIPQDVRQRLKTRMAKRQYDDIVSIRRDSISGKDSYGATIWDMHFGTRKVCRHVTRSGWTDKTEERGLVYCESGQCILVPTVCRNVSRITRAAVADESADGPVLAMVPASYPAPAGAWGPLASADGISDFDARSSPLAVVPGTSFAGSGGDTVDGPGVGSGSGGFGGGGGGGGGGTWQTGAGPVPGGGFGGASSPPASTVPTAPVPEPETWALLLLGFGVVGRKLASARHAKREHRLHPR